MIKKRFRLPILFLITLLTSQYGAATVALPSEYSKWMNEDVRWIIGAQEKEAFLKLATNEERDHFIGEFWERRNPNPGRQGQPIQRGTLPAPRIFQ